MIGVNPKSPSKLADHNVATAGQEIAQIHITRIGIFCCIMIAMNSKDQRK